MALTCNIDERGRAIRYRIGFTLLLLGVLAFVVASRFDRTLGFVLAGPLVAAGAFSLFEANRRWCAARALGFKTKF